MHTLLALALTALVAQDMPSSVGIHDLTISTPAGTSMTYAVSIPKDYSPKRPVPLVLVLHSGGERFPHYGREFMKLLVQPALADLGAIMVAPDCPTGSWTDATTEQAVIALLQQAMQVYAIDRRRVLVTGFSMGGSGTWFFASRHTDIFTAAIPMAASTGAMPLAQLGTVPMYVIHSRDDQVVPFAPAERAVKELAAMGRPVQFDALSRLSHFEMFRYVDALKRAGRWILGRWADGP